MKVLLVKPTRKSDSITPPLGIGYIATRIRNRHEVKIVDGPKIELDQRKFARILNEFKPDVVGLHVLTLDLNAAWEYFSIVRQSAPNAITVAGGPQPSGEPRDTMYHFGDRLDYAFAGEAEDGFSKLLDLLEKAPARKPTDVDLAEVPGLIWRSANGIAINQRKQEPDLDALGFPAWDLIDPATYPHAPHAAYAKAFPVGYIASTRGCPFDCDFCAASVTQGRKLRKRSVDHVLEEIGILVNKYGMREIHFVDDNFTFDRGYVVEFCEKKTKLFPDIPWTCPNGVRMDTLDAELIDMMKRSGCHVLSMGIESGSQRVLDSMKKSQSIESIRAKVKMIVDAGIDAVGFFILGFPGETLDDMRETMKLSLELPLIRAQFMFYHPVPGTAAYNRIVKECPERLGKVESELHSIAYVDKGMRKSELYWMQKRAFLRFYLRPRQFVNIFAKIKSRQQLLLIARRMIRWMILG